MCLSTGAGRTISVPVKWLFSVPNNPYDKTFEQLGIALGDLIYLYDKKRFLSGLLQTGRDLLKQDQQLIQRRILCTIYSTLPELLNLKIRHRKK